MGSSWNLPDTLRLRARTFQINFIYWAERLNLVKFNYEEDHDGDNIYGVICCLCSSRQCHHYATYYSMARDTVTHFATYHSDHLTAYTLSSDS